MRAREEPAEARVPFLIFDEENDLGERAVTSGTWRGCDVQLAPHDVTLVEFLRRDVRAHRPIKPAASATRERKKAERVSGLHHLFGPRRPFEK